MVEKGIRKTFQGTVISNKMQKSVLVKVDRYFTHPRYKKTMRRSRKYMAHDEKDLCSIGDVVRIMETKPRSKTKCWLVTDIITKGK